MYAIPNMTELCPPGIFSIVHSFLRYALCIFTLYPLLSPQNEYYTLIIILTDMQWGADHCPLPIVNFQFSITHSRPQKEPWFPTALNL